MINVSYVSTSSRILRTVGTNHLVMNFLIINHRRITTRTALYPRRLSYPHLTDTTILVGLVPLIHPCHHLLVLQLARLHLLRGMLSQAPDRHLQLETIVLMARRDSPYIHLLLIPTKIVEMPTRIVEHQINLMRSSHLVYNALLHQLMEARFHLL